jgi:FkbM family methyltransferase|tara:strand:+ start:3132 stop:3602 length:471 start_codon:yes stop_codon:yes gene_type:complete
MSENCIRQSAFPKVKNFRTYIVVGARSGETSVPFISDFSRVYAFEPNPKLNLVIPNTVKMFPYKLGDIEMETVLNVSSSTQYSVTQKTLDSFDFGNVDLIKIDVGYSELDVLQGAVNTIVKWHPVVVFKHDLAVDFFNKLSYNVKYYKNDWIAWYE